MANLRQKNRGSTSFQDKTSRKVKARKAKKRLVNKRSSKGSRNLEGKSNRNIKSVSNRTGSAKFRKNAKLERSIDVDKETEKLVKNLLFPFDFNKYGILVRRKTTYGSLWSRKVSK